jgi:DNA/RNA-binding domain of Phe-tRNA-synthetase-like protein
MILKISTDLSERFPELRVLAGSIRGVRVERRSEELEGFKKEVIERVKKEHELGTLKDVPIFRAYRDFFWRVGIDPTKNRPAGEALIRRILRDKQIPSINTLVDAYNLASIKTGIALAAFDADKLEGGLRLRFAREAEEFLGIGMESPLELKGGEVVIADAEKLVAIYPYRDSDETKVTLSTKNVLLLICGVPDIREETLQDALKTAVGYIIRFCGGEFVKGR